MDSGSSGGWWWKWWCVVVVMGGVGCGDDHGCVVVIVLCGDGYGGCGVG